MQNKNKRVSIYFTKYHTDVELLTAVTAVIKIMSLTIFKDLPISLL